MSTESVIWKNLVIYIVVDMIQICAETRHKPQGFIYLLTEKHMFFHAPSFQLIFRLPLPSAKKVTVSLSLNVYAL